MSERFGSFLISSYFIPDFLDAAWSTYLLKSYIYWTEAFLVESLVKILKNPSDEPTIRSLF